MEPRTYHLNLTKHPKHYQTVLIVVCFSVLHFHLCVSNPGRDYLPPLLVEVAVNVITSQVDMLGGGGQSFTIQG